MLVSFITNQSSSQNVVWRVESRDDVKPLSILRIKSYPLTEEVKNKEDNS